MQNHNELGDEWMEKVSQVLDAVCLAAQIILECGGETYRAEDTVERMCKGFGVPKVDVLALPTGLMLTLAMGEEKSLTRIVRVHSRSIHLKKLDQCNGVSRKVASGEMNALEALEALEAIKAECKDRKWLMIGASALSASAFAVMLGGFWIEFFIALFCGAAVQFISVLMARHRMPGMISGLITGALTTLLALLGTLIFPGANVEPVISGSIMPLLPGLATTNGIRDTIRGDLVSGGARIMEAILCAIMLAAGIGLVLSMWRGVIG